MSPRGHRQKETLHKVERSVSPDDVKFLLLERDRLAAADDRTEAQRWLGEPPKHRSALAMKQTLKQS
jgi:ferric-dicitrate binding protein FerR (iron transport regulator)